MPVLPATLRHHAATVLTGLALAGLFWWGHHTGWRLAKPAAETPHTASEHWCPEHHVPEDACLLCKKHLGKAQATQEPERHRRAGEEIRFAQVASPEALAKAGITTATVAEESVAPRLRVAGETVFPPTAVARLGTRADGMVRDLLVRLGDAVAPGAVVAVVEAAEVGRAKSALMTAVTAADLARRQAVRTRSTAAAGVRTAADLEEAEARLRTVETAVFDAEQGLRNLGLPVDAASLAGLDAATVAERLRRMGLPEGYDDRGSANLMTIVAPRAGRVTGIQAVTGEAVTAGDAIIVVAADEEVWLSLPLTADRAALVAAGQAVEFRSATGASATGAVTTVARAADPHTRLITAWAALKQPDDGLRVGLFGTATITTGEPVAAAVVPPGAIQFDGAQAYVFVRRSETIFRTLPVRILARDGDRIAVDRLAAGDEVAVSGIGILFAATFPERMGAGCTDGH